MDIKVKSFKLNPKPNGSHDQHFPSLSIEEFTPITVQYLYLLLSWWAPTNCSCLHVKHATKCLCCDRYTILMDLLLQLTKWQRLSWTRSRHFILCLLLLLLLDRVVSFTNWIIALPLSRCCANMRLPEVLPYSNWLSHNNISYPRNSTRLTSNDKTYCGSPTIHHLTLCKTLVTWEFAASFSSLLTYNKLINLFMKIIIMIRQQYSNNNNNNNIRGHNTHTLQCEHERHWILILLAEFASQRVIWWLVKRRMWRSQQQQQ